MEPEAQLLTLHGDEASLFGDEASKSGELGLALFGDVDAERFAVRLHPGGRVDRVAEEAVARHRKANDSGDDGTYR